IIPFFSISSAGPVCSIFLFSKLPLEKLDRKTIAVSSHSDTSVALLKVILKNFFSLNCKFISIKSGSLKKILNASPACLLIGDEAMKEAKKAVARCELRVAGKKQSSKLRTQDSGPMYIYDLGELWFKHTGLPFVFALWIVRKKSLVQKEGLVKRLSLDLISAKKYASKNLSSIARQSPQRKWLSTRELVNYWKGISYDFTEKHMEGLLLFEKYVFLNKREY
ncbi:MAG: menaquinone biosynthesis protein, partial [Thermodesulfovibrionia bacterium]|nr:menaquinone biosynthesis protein [Thermodesulfovibrionia bacterium]